MTQLQLKTGSGFLDPTDVQVKGSGGWSTVNKVHVFTSSGWVEVWPLGVLTAYSVIEVLIMPPGGGSSDDFYDSATYPVVDISQSTAEAFAYITLTFTLGYDDTGYSGGTSLIYNHPADFYLKRVSDDEEILISDIEIEWAEPSLSIDSTLTVAADSLYTVLGDGTYTMFVETTLNGTLYRFSSPQQLVMTVA